MTEIPVAVPFTLPASVLTSGAVVLIEEPSVRLPIVRSFLWFFGVCGAGFVVASLLGTRNMGPYPLLGLPPMLIGLFKAWRVLGPEYLELRRPRVLGQVKGHFYIGRVGSPTPLVNGDSIELRRHRTVIQQKVGPSWSGWSLVAWVSDAWIMIIAAKWLEELIAEAGRLPDWLRVPVVDGPELVATGYVRLL
jgi:hypothetical protein